MRTIKPGCTTRYTGLSYPRVMYNSDHPSLRNMMDKFGGEKEKRRRNRTKTVSPNFVWETKYLLVFRHDTFTFIQI